MTERPQHQIPIGTLVEVKYHRWHGDGASQKTHARMYVAEHYYSNGTPLYALQFNKNNLEGHVIYTSNGMEPFPTHPEISESILNHRERPFMEEDLTVISLTPDILSGKDILEWDDLERQAIPIFQYHESLDGFTIHPAYQKWFISTGVLESPPVDWIGCLLCLDNGFGEILFENDALRVKHADQIHALGLDPSQVFFLEPKRFQTGEDGPCHTDEFRKSFWTQTLRQLRVTPELLQRLNTSQIQYPRENRSHFFIHYSSDLTNPESPWVSVAKVTIVEDKGENPTRHLEFETLDQKEKVSLDPRTQEIFEGLPQFTEQRLELLWEFNLEETNDHLARFFSGVFRAGRTFLPISE